jgi:hypothetical protein
MPFWRSMFCRSSGSGRQSLGLFYATFCCCGTFIKRNASEASGIAGNDYRTCVLSSLIYSPLLPYFKWFYGCAYYSKKFEVVGFMGLKCNCIGKYIFLVIPIIWEILSVVKWFRLVQSLGPSRVVAWTHIQFPNHCVQFEILRQNPKTINNNCDTLYHRIIFFQGYNKM